MTVTRVRGMNPSNYNCPWFFQAWFHMTGEGMTSRVFTRRQAATLWLAIPLVLGRRGLRASHQVHHGGMVPWEVVRLGQAQLHALFRREKCGDGGGACRLENNGRFFGWTWAWREIQDVYIDTAKLRLDQQGISWWFQDWFSLARIQCHAAL